MQDNLKPLAPLSIVVPAFNAAPVLGTTVPAIGRWLAQSGLEYELIIVDDGSKDDTAEVAAKVLAAFGRRGRLLRHEVNQGKGAAVRTGMLASTGAWAIFLDADHSTDISHAERVASAAAAGADVVIGSRRVKGADVVCTRPKARQWLGDLFPVMTRMISRHGASDSQCGFKALRRWAIVPVFSGLQTKRFAFDIELLLRARRAGANVQEVPVRWDNPSESTLRVARDGPSMLWDTVCATWKLRTGSALAESLRQQGHAARDAAQESVIVEVRPIRTAPTPAVEVLSQAEARSVPTE